MSLLWRGLVGAAGLWVLWALLTGLAGYTAAWP